MRSDLSRSFFLAGRAAFLGLTILLFFTSGLFLCSQPAFAEPLESTQNLPPQLIELKKRTDAISSVHMDFIQETHIPMFAVPVVSRGQFLFIRPDTLVWEYREPFAEGLATQDGHGFSWQGNTRVSGTMPEKADPMVAEIVNQMKAWIALDTQWISRQYDISLLGESPVTFMLVPRSKDMASIIKSLEISFDENGLASSVTLNEQQGGRTVIRFENARLNALAPAPLEELLLQLSE